jgi:hypothetical protein
VRVAFLDPLSLLARAARSAISVLAGMLGEARRAMMDYARGHAVDMLRLEHDELENAFLTILVGSLAGMPLAPPGLALEVLPLLKDEIGVMYERHVRARDALAEYAGLGG